MYKSVVIGSGIRGDQYLQSYKYSKTAEVVGCSDISEEKAEKLAKDYGLNAYTDPEIMLEREKPDMVHICTHADSHYELLRLVDEYQIKCCTCEKPLAVSSPDYQKLVELEKKTRTKIAVSHQFRWYKYIQLIREAIRSGKLGNIRFIDMSAGMNIVAQGTHLINYGMFLNDDHRVKSVFASSSGLEELDDFHPAPDLTAGSLVFENDVRALLNCGYTSPRVGDFSEIWKHVRLSAYCDNGRVNWEEFGITEIAIPGASERFEPLSMDEWISENLRAQNRFHQAVFDWYEKDEPCGTSLEQSLHEFKVILALYGSSLYRKPIDMHSYEPTNAVFEKLKTALR